MNAQDQHAKGAAEIYCVLLSLFSDAKGRLTDPHNLLERAIVKEEDRGVVLSYSVGVFGCVPPPQFQNGADASQAIAAFVLSC